jgi:hypothetical protein
MANKEKAYARNCIGFFLISFSYLVGLPAVGLMGALSAYWQEPLFIIIGGPFLQFMSYLVFFMGIHLGGGKYIMAFFGWAAKVKVEKR